MASHFYEIRKLTYGYQIVQVGARADGQVHSLTIAPEPTVPDYYLQDVAQQCLFTIQSARKLPTAQRFQEAQRIVLSRVQNYHDCIAWRSGNLQD